MPELITTLGPVGADALDMILPHEHVFVDLRTCDQPGYAEADAADVVALMAPQLEAARRSGVTALVECTPAGVGRRADILRRVSEATGFPLVVPTGIYREPWAPPWAHAASEDALYGWMRSELDGEIAGTGVRAGFIKLSAGDDGLTATETKILRAAVRAAMDTGAVIGSHTILGRVVKDQLRVFESLGHDAGRFIWIHTQAEPDFDLHVELARRGAWIEYDNLGWEQDEPHIERILRVLDAGLGGRLLLSHDMGWYDPAQPGGGVPRSFTYLSEVFLPKLREAGVNEATIQQLICGNPFQAFSR